ncbi:unnamed protein product [Prorocentrum cordatum]|uniref:Reverse transcriptase domain-containing protein n=1 Tax=Prorocentrum cordatum TaxID=2364126 RepID=A0ABN9QFX5_9DINO|nr:unnamed protein product [Polarella glacialis]
MDGDDADGAEKSPKSPIRQPDFGQAAEGTGDAGSNDFENGDPDRKSMMTKMMGMMTNMTKDMNAVRTGMEEAQTNAQQALDIAKETDAKVLEVQKKKITRDTVQSMIDASIPELQKAAMTKDDVQTMLDEDIMGEESFGREVIKQIELPNRDLFVDFCMTFDLLVANTVLDLPDTFKATFHEAGVKPSSPVTGENFNALDLLTILDTMEQERKARRTGNREAEEAIRKRAKLSAKRDRAAWLESLTADGKWNCIKQITKRKPCPQGRLRDTGGTCVATDERADTFAEHLSNIQWHVRPVTLTPGADNSLFPWLDMDVGPFTEPELREVIAKMRCGKACKPDDIPAEVSKALAEELGQLDWVLDMCNEAWEHKDIPEDWASSRVRLLYKKSDPARYDNYQPLSLQCVALKAFSAMLKNRLLAAGCTLSPLLFVLVMTAILHDAVTLLPVGARRAYDAGELADCVYADDTLLTGKRYAMELHWQKFQVLAVRSAGDIRAPDGSQLKHGEHMQYLGAQLKADANMYIWSHSSLTWNRKLRIDASIVESKLLYGLSSACFTEAHYCSDSYNSSAKCFAPIPVIQLHACPFAAGTRPATARYVRRVGRPHKEFVPEMSKHAACMFGSMPAAVRTACTPRSGSADADSPSSISATRAPC